ncbi:MAG: NAD(P)/FAD-dependent oxidoreductase [Candidatus Woesearchaeota archaeon]
MDKMYDLIIVGGGIAGITAAIYAARKEMKFIIISPEFGGEIVSTTYVENWPGIKSITGRELAKNYLDHMKSLGVEIVEDLVTEVKHDDHFQVTTYGGIYESKTLIWATGSRFKELGVPGEGELRSRGVTYCSICDGPLYKNKVVAVVGAGNVALTSAIYMANIAKKVYIINRSGNIRGDPILLDKLNGMSTVEIVNNAKVKSINGEKEVNSITLEDGQEIQLNGIIINIGHIPITEPIKNIVELNIYGYVEVDRKNMTKTEGLFAAGDVVFNPYKQLVISASDGAKAALGAYDYLSSKK